MVSMRLRNESSWAAQSGQIENIARIQPEYQLPLSTPRSAQWCQLHSNRTKLQLKPVICLTSCELVSLSSILSKYYSVHLTGCSSHWSSTSSIVSKHYGCRDSCEEVQYKPKESRWHWHSGIHLTCQPSTVYTGFIYCSGNKQETDLHPEVWTAWYIL